MHDLIIQGGTIVDGAGTPAFVGDVAVSDGRIAEIGRGLGSARRVIEADGLLVTPGWVDVHTHYDGQATWDSLLAPSIWHGVTSVVMGNCGVGFAPVAADRRAWFIDLMSGVEDIPSEALAAGLPWSWESFPEYLQALEAMPRALDVGAMISHGPVRVAIMGDRGAKNERATPEDIAGMGEVVKQALRAGALGFSTSRTVLHAALGGDVVPGTFAEEAELMGIAQAIGEAGHGVIESAPAGVGGEELGAILREIAWMGRVSAATGVVMTFPLPQVNSAPQEWREALRCCEEANRSGARIVPQAFARPICVLFSFQSDSIFHYMPSFEPLLKTDHVSRMTALRDPELRAKIVSDINPNTTGLSIVYEDWENIYPMGSPMNYLPDRDDSIAAIARRTGRPAREIAYDLMLALDGRAFLMFAGTGYSEGNRNAMHAMLRHPATILAGSDGGAHVRSVCDSSVPTFLLTQWVRDLEPDDPHRLPLEYAVKRLTSDGAKVFGLHDRGVLQPGKKADINLIDFNGLSLNQPEMRNDLPTGKPRLVQTARGYEATLVSGEVVQERGQDTGARPGRVIRALVS
jgi:N-acyl-D-aspartate/D-glutamate deacylase